MMERVLITGASGFLGYHIISAAIKQNLEVFAAVRKNSNTDHLKDYPVKYLFLNYEDENELAKLLVDNKINYIIHAAGITKAVKQQQYNDINAGYAVKLAKAAALSSSCFKKMVFISSLAATGPSAIVGGFITEQTEPNPVTAYGKSKLLAEKELFKTGIPIVALRPTAIYGPRDKEIFLMIKTVSKGFDPYMGNIKQKLSFVHAFDVAAVAVNALFLHNTGIFNITDGFAYDRYQFADITKMVLNRKAIRFHIPMPLVKILAYSLETINGWRNKPAVINREKLKELVALNWACDISKAKKELSYVPSFNLEDGLKDSITWYQKNKLL